MKKTLLMIISIITAVIITGCTAAVNKPSYSYRFGFVTENEDMLLESYKYNVVNEDMSGRAITAPYYYEGEGEYTVNIYKTAEQNIFSIETDLSFTGRFKFTYNDSYSTEFTDTVSAKSTVNITSLIFSPISSEKTYDIHLPSDQTDALKRARFVSKIDYSLENSEYKITSSVEDLDIDGENLTGDDIVSIADENNNPPQFTTDSRIVDNEHIMLAIRLQNLNNTFNDSFEVYDSLNGLLKNISTTSNQNFETKTFDNGNGEQEYSCYVVTSTISAKNKGSDTVMYFAQNYFYDYETSDEVLPVNINLLLEFKHAGLIYTLKEYTNYAKGEFAD